MDLSIGSVLDVLVLKNDAECTSQRLKRTSGARVLIFCFWLLGISYWLLVIGDWLLAIGYWLLVIGKQCFSKRPFTTQNMESEMAMDLCIDEKDEERESEAQSGKGP